MHLWDSFCIFKGLFRSWNYFWNTSLSTTLPCRLKVSEIWGKQRQTGVWYLFLIENALCKNVNKCLDWHKSESSSDLQDRRNFWCPVHTHKLQEIEKEKTWGSKHWGNLLWTAHTGFTVILQFFFFIFLLTLTLMHIDEVKCICTLKGPTHKWFLCFA